MTVAGIKTFMACVLVWAAVSGPALAKDCPDKAPPPALPKILDALNDAESVELMAVARIRDLMLRNEMYEAGADLLIKASRRTKDLSLRRAALFAASDLLEKGGFIEDAALVMVQVIAMRPSVFTPSDRPDVATRRPGRRKLKSKSAPRQAELAGQIRRRAQQLKSRSSELDRREAQLAEQKRQLIKREKQLARKQQKLHQLERLLEKQGKVLRGSQKKIRIMEERLRDMMKLIETSNPKFSTKPTKPADEDQDTEDIKQSDR